MKNTGKAIVCMIALVIAVAAISINSVALVNFDSYEYKFDFPDGGIGVTNYMEKEDSSYIYVSVESSAFPVCFHPMGSGKYMVPDVAQGPDKELSQGECAYLTNYVYENGYPLTAVMGQATVNDFYTATGTWAPNTGIF